MKKVLLIFTLAVLSAVPLNVFAQSGEEFGFNEAEFMTDSLSFIQNKAAFAAMVNKFRADNPERQHMSNPVYDNSPFALTSNSCFAANYVIPVVVHVVRYGNDFNIGSGTNISEAQIDNAIEIASKIAKSFCPIFIKNPHFRLYPFS